MASDHIKLDLPKFWHWPHAEDRCHGTADYHGHTVPAA